MSPFARLARPHGFALGGDALVAMALADSVFFSLDPNDARWRVALYLMLTVAPFAVVAQFLGPLVDRLSGGNRLVLVGVGAGRGIMAVLMAGQVDTLLFFPMAFGMLVMGKTHHIAKSALVPDLVDDPTKLVRANSRLSIISAVSAGIAAIPGGILLLVGGAPWVLAFAGVVFTTGAVLGLQIPKIQHVRAEPDTAEVPEIALRRGGILLASSAMAYVRAVTGFLTMLLAFALRGGVDPGPTGPGVEMGHRVREALGLGRLDLAVGGSPTWHFGAVIAASGVGNFAGALVSPRLRHRFPEERILAGMLGLMGLVGILGALAGGLVGAMIVGFVVAVGAAVGKQSFDAIVQRDSPSGDLSHSFAKFESRFQLAWVFGALIPVVVPLPARLGFLVLAATAGFAAVSYWLGKDPAPNTEAARRSARVASERATQKMIARTDSIRSRRYRRPSPSPEDQGMDERPGHGGGEPTAEHPDLTRMDQGGGWRSTHRPASLTDTQPMPVIGDDDLDEFSGGTADG